MSAGQTVTDRTAPFNAVRYTEISGYAPSCLHKHCPYLSGGQKQRTALARGLIRDAPVLILDDCFSSVDTETEEHILTRLKSMRRDKTTILVSHRVSTLRHSDRIVVLDEGRIVEIGTHEELLRKQGVYAELERVQTEGGSFTPAFDEADLTPSGI